MTDQTEADPFARVRAQLGKLRKQALLEAPYQWTTVTHAALDEMEAALTEAEAAVRQDQETHEREREELQCGRWRTFKNSCPRTFPNIPMTERECSCVDCVEIRNARDVEAAREILKRDAAFQEWAEGWLDAGRWAGHDHADAIKTEVLELEAELAALRQRRYKRTRRKVG